MNSNIRRAMEFFSTDLIDSDRTEIRFNCPFCIEKRGKTDSDHKLYFNVKSGFYYCFKCHSKGNLYLSGDSEQSVSEIYRDIMELFNPTEEIKYFEESELYYIPRIKASESRIASEYLRDRGIHDDDIDFYDIRLGDGRELGRVIVPNKLFGVSRCFTDMYSARTFIGKTPKYLNPPECKKSDSVFNLHNIKNGDRIIIVEGVFTAISSGRDAVAIYGSYPSKRQIESILNKDPSEIYCVLDGDAYENNLKMARAILENGFCGELFVVRMPIGKDANDMGKKDFLQYLDREKIRYTSNSDFVRNLLLY